MSSIFRSGLYRLVEEMIDAHLNEEMRSCCGFVMLWASDETPPLQFCIELGYGLALDKSVVIMAMPGSKVPRKILDVAEGVIMHDFLEGDPDETSRLVHDEFDRLTAEGKITHVEGVCRHTRVGES